LFTQALCSLLPDNSLVYAVDRDLSALNEIKIDSRRVAVEKILKDFIQDDLGVSNLDGILMANALHFAPSPLSILKNLKKSLHISGRLILIEYDMTTANRWVPYPVSFQALTTMIGDSGFSSISKIAEYPSVYHRGNIYAAVIEQ
jgi:hypothetical protein